MLSASSLRVAVGRLPAVASIVLLSCLTVLPAACSPAKGRPFTDTGYFAARKDQVLQDNHIATTQEARRRWRTKTPIVLHIVGSDYARDGRTYKTDYQVVVGPTKHLPRRFWDEPGADGIGPMNLSSPAATEPTTRPPEEDEATITLIPFFPFVVFGDGWSMYTGSSPTGSTAHVVAGADGTTFILRVLRSIIIDSTGTHHREQHILYVPPRPSPNGNVWIRPTAGNYVSKVVHENNKLIVTVDLNGTTVIDFSNNEEPMTQNDRDLCNAVIAASSVIPDP